MLIQITEKLQTGSRKAAQAMGQSREQARAVVDQSSLASSSLTTIVHRWHKSIEWLPVTSL